MSDYKISEHWQDTFTGTINDLRRDRFEERRKGVQAVGEVVTSFLERFAKTVELIADPEPEALPTVETRRRLLKMDFNAVAQSEATKANKPAYVYNEPIKSLLNTLIDYLIGETHLPTHKGIMLIGPPGSGKTMIMKIFARVLRGAASRPGGLKVRENCLGFQFKSATELCADELSRKGEQLMEFFNDYGRRITSTIEGLPFNHLCIDDLGKEEIEKAYSFGKNPVKQILNDRYDRRKHGILTHATSNLDIEELGQVYGPALVDRFREMFYIIELNNDSFRN